MPYPSDFNDTVVYNGTDLYVPKDCSVTVFDDSRVFLFGEWYLNGQPVMSGSAAISGAEVSVSTVQPVDPGIALWFDTSSGYGELKVKVGGNWITVEDPADSVAANEVQISSAQPVVAGAELWVDTNVVPENLKAKIGGSWKSINSEVAIGGTVPTDPAVELWVDTASAAPSLPEGYVSPGNALGVIAVGTVLDLVNIPANTETKITGDIPVTLLAGRRYRVNWGVRAFYTATTPNLNIYLRNGTTKIYSVGNYYGSGVSALFEPLANSWIINGDSTTKSLNVSIECNIVVNHVFGDGSAFFYVEDLGPNVRPAYPLTSPPPDGYVSPGNALGIVGVGSFISNGNPYQLVANVATVITNNLSCTLLVGRRYAVNFSIRSSNSNGADTNLQIRLKNGSTQIAGNVNATKRAGNDYINYRWLLDGDGTAFILNVELVSTVIVNLNLDTAQYFYIEDVGPNVSPALPVPATPPAWTPVTFQNNWVNMGGSYSPTSYRMIGDVVQMRINAKSGTTGQPILTLPVGFRPPNTMPFPIVADLASGSSIYPAQLNIENTGAVSAYNVVNNYVLAGFLQFSVTP